MASCSFCGSPHLEDADFCNVCGASTGLLEIGISEEDPSSKLPARTDAAVVLTGDQLREQFHDGTRKAPSLTVQASSTDPTPFYLLLSNQGHRRVEVKLTAKSHLIEFETNGSRTSEPPSIFVERHQRSVPVRVWVSPPQGLDAASPGSIDLNLELCTDGAQSRTADVAHDPLTHARVFDRRFEFPDGLFITVPVTLEVAFLRPPELKVDQDVLLFTEYVHERPLTLINRGDSKLRFDGIVLPGHAELYDAEGRQFNLVQEGGQLVAKIPDLGGQETRHLRLVIRDLSKITPGESVDVIANIGGVPLPRSVQTLRKVDEQSQFIPAAVFGIDFGTRNTTISFMEIGAGSEEKGFVTDGVVEDEKERTRWPSLFAWHRERGWLFGKDAEIPGSGEDWNFYAHFQVRGLKTLIRSKENEYVKEKYHVSMVKALPIEGRPEDEWHVLASEDIRELGDEEAAKLKEIQVVHWPQDPQEREAYLKQFTNEALLATYLGYLNQLIHDHIVRNPNEHGPFSTGDPSTVDYKVYFTLPILDRDLDTGGHNDKAMLEKAALVAGFPKGSFDWVLEPESAALYFVKNWAKFHAKYAWRGDLNDGDLILIFDAGAGTTDVALLRVELKEGEASFRALGICGGLQPAEGSDTGIQLYAGNHITQKTKEAMIKAHGQELDEQWGIYDVANRRLRDLFPGTQYYQRADGTANKSVTPEMLDITAEILKLRLNPTDESAPPNPAQAELVGYPITMTGEEFKTAANDILERMVQLVSIVLSARGNVTGEQIPAMQIKHLFLVGGTSNILHLPQMLGRVRTSLRDIDPYDRMHAVAGGAIERFSTRIAGRAGLDVFLVTDSAPQDRNLLGTQSPKHLVRSETVALKFEAGSLFECRPGRTYPVEVKIKHDGKLCRVGEFIVDNSKNPKEARVRLFAEIREEPIDLAGRHAEEAHVLHIFFELGDNDPVEAFEYRLE